MKDCISDKRAAFARFKEAFDKIAPEPTIQVLQLTRQIDTKDFDEPKDGLVDWFPDELAGPWKLFERRHCHDEPGQQRIEELYFGTGSKNSRRRWLSLARLSGDALCKWLFSAGQLPETKGVILWVETLIALSLRNVLTLPVAPRFVPCPECDTLDLNRVAPNGTRIDDAVLSSLHLADWLAANDWPFEHEDSPKKGTGTSKRPEQKRPAGAKSRKPAKIDDIRADKLVQYLTDGRLHLKWIKAKKPNGEKLQNFLDASESETDLEGWKKLRERTRRTANKYGYLVGETKQWIASLEKEIKKRLKLGIHVPGAEDRD